MQKTKEMNINQELELLQRFVGYIYNVREDYRSNAHERSYDDGVMLGGLLAELRNGLVGLQASLGYSFVPPSNVMPGQQQDTKECDINEQSNKQDTNAMFT